VDGGRKDGRGPLGCGLEKRPPCPRGTGQNGMPRAEAEGVSPVNLSVRFPSQTITLYIFSIQWISMDIRYLITCYRLDRPNHLNDCLTRSLQA